MEKTGYTLLKTFQEWPAEVQVLPASPIELMLSGETR
jgi:hypothetical protein